jgi:type IV pilus assembly protein PilA
MLARLRKAKEEGEGGFTLIELLVVIIIIGILAAIAIPTFLNQRVKGWESAAKSELKNAATAQESYFTDAVPAGYTTDVANLETEGLNRSGNITFAIVSASTTDYCMSAVHASGGDKYYIDSETGVPSTDACT